MSVVALEADLLPQVFGRMSPLNRLHVQVALSVGLLDGGIPAVGERAAAAVAQPRDIVLVAAKVLCLRLRLEAAVVVVDHLCA